MGRLPIVESKSLRQLIERVVHSDPAVAGPAALELFRDVVEPLSDSFDPYAWTQYVDVFVPIIAALLPGHSETALRERYQRVRHSRPFSGEPSTIRDVFVLSRVTLGADIAVTSVMLDAARKRFPRAVIHFAGGHKGWELFENGPRLRHLPVPYPRGGTLRDKLAVGETLRAALARPDCVVIDPDSRLTQLGLVPVCREENYYFFESRSYGSYENHPLPELARRWAAEVFGIDDAAPFIAPTPCEDTPAITVSLGVGENLNKRVPDPFEEDLVRHLAGLGVDLLIDLGAGGEEAGRVQRAIARSGAPPGRIRTWDGAFAPFAARIARSRLYVGYDSAGQHAAAASGVPLVTVFAGYVTDRMFHRWHPAGPGPIEVVRVERPDPARVIEQTVAAVSRVSGMLRG